MKPSRLGPVLALLAGPALAQHEGHGAPAEAKAPPGDGAMLFLRIAGD